METFQRLETGSFAELLHSCIKNATFANAMQEAIAAFPQYRSQIPFAAGKYTRTLVRKSHEFEIVATQWAPGALSPIHDHGESRCWIVVLEGALEVESYERLDDGVEPVAKLERVFDTRVNVGELDHRLNWRELHRVRNVLPLNVYSLQLYAPAQTTYTVVDPDTLHCRIQSATYDSILSS